MLQIRTMAQLLHCDAFDWKGSVSTHMSLRQLLFLFTILGMLVSTMSIIECTEPLRNGDI